MRLYFFLVNTLIQESNETQYFEFLMFKDYEFL